MIQRILKQGAEAIIYLDKIDRQEVLVKERVKKKYRLEQIDQKLRRERTRQEIKLMRESRGIGVLTPKVISSDENTSKIVMEKIGGVLVKDFLKSKSNYQKICRQIGEQIGKLHSVGIIHGDLTTSNMIVVDNTIYFLDFGLGSFSKRIEDMATDLSVLQEALKATHNKIYKDAWNKVIAGYKKEKPLGNNVLKVLGEIESRGRYAT
jgi:Kae1-associated kinase Bud32